jgi:hypothetical protein
MKLSNNQATKLGVKDQVRSLEALWWMLACMCLYLVVIHFVSF